VGFRDAICEGVDWTELAQYRTSDGQASVTTSYPQDRCLGAERALSACCAGTI
jgi:hypothetical protein